MRAVIGDFTQWPAELRDHRKRTGADRWDEMWDGVLHLAPVPNREHGDLQFGLRSWIHTHWAKPNGNRVHHEINLATPGGWDKNYRIPDLLLLTPDRFDIDYNTHFEGAPLVVVEIHSPGDEAYEKLPFYADLGVPEAWIIHRDTKRPENYVLRGGSYTLMSPAADGWVRSTVTPIELRAADDQKLAIRLTGEPNSEARLPER